MNGQAIGSQAIGEAALRRLASEQSGPRPAGVRSEEKSAAVAGERVARATRP